MGGYGAEIGNKVSWLNVVKFAVCTLAEGADPSPSAGEHSLFYRLLIKPLDPLYMKLLKFFIAACLTTLPSTFSYHR